jgi:hypothetical protein
MSTIEPRWRWRASAASYLATVFTLLLCGNHDVLAQKSQTFRAQGCYSAELQRGSVAKPSKVIVHVGTGEVFTHKFLSHPGNGRIIRLERATKKSSRVVEESLDHGGGVVFVGPGTVTYLNPAPEACFVTFHKGPVPKATRTGY